MGGKVLQKLNQTYISLYVIIYSFHTKTNSQYFWPPITQPVFKKNSKIFFVVIKCSFSKVDHK